MIQMDNNLKEKVKQILCEPETIEYVARKVFNFIEDKEKDKEFFLNFYKAWGD